ncbi:Gfo/Idh/MocA family oxidoreductase [Bradyrhizobium liaoningense]|uniref:Gfo/Idh/MocA family protein n=1 Tax=Bradyrhizobium liaoningense TaxID=43992 RepID=UPI001BACBF0A|nr:Gfo/Idh/MocA family oxidoreductase [Bradyrhizobium liaoningense]MBR0741404.1 Gfo/Idh/MocA family oxidoreductase [Bradyrhizobium liaoningense]
MPIPLVVVGGGRWGRTWLSVVVAARGSAEGVVLAARSRPDEVRTWAAARSELAGLTVVPTVAEAMLADRQPQAAIISSRPRDHIRDGMDALEHGLHVLVEKPVGVDPGAGRTLVAAAHHRKRILAVGTEFAYLPAFHQMSEEFAGADGADMTLIWEDVENEVRHGATKARHEETGLLYDLMPHALSIFRVFGPNAGLRIGAAQESPDGCRGHIEFRDDRGGRHEFRCDTRATARRRLLELRTKSGHASVDFSGAHGLMTINGQPRTLDPRMSVMTSTLRLELGAFLLQVTVAKDAALPGWDVSGLLAVQADLKRALAAGT